jgi:hypothetical protein
MKLEPAFDAACKASTAWVAAAKPAVMAGTLVNSRARETWQARPTSTGRQGRARLFSESSQPSPRNATTPSSARAVSLSGMSPPTAVGALYRVKRFKEIALDRDTTRPSCFGALSSRVCGFARKFSAIAK